MKFKEFVILTSVALLTSTAANAKTKYDDVLGKLIPPNINYTAQVEKQSALKGFDQINIAIKDRKTGTIFHRYLWISKDKKTIVPVVLSYNNGKIGRIQPKNVIQRTPVNVNWLNNLLKDLPMGIKKSIGKGQNVYMFSDPFCPYCKRELPQLVKLAEEGKIKLHILPYNVHGELAKKASAIFLDIEEKQGLKSAIDKIESAGFADVERQAKTNKNVDKLLKKYSKYMDKIAKAAQQHGINGTPGTIVKTSKSKGYLFIGLSDISPYIKK